MHEQSQEYFPAPQATSPNTLFHRRQRSNTAPSAVVSPLAAVSTSLGGWNGPVTATDAATAGIPSFAVSYAEELYAVSPSSAQGASLLPEDAIPYGEFFGQEHFAAPSSLGVPELEVDMDRTPRRADFPVGIQEQYTQNPHVSALGYPTMHSTYELQSYAAGLEDLNISAPLQYGPSCGVNAAAPYEEIDFSEYLTMNNY